MNRSKDIAESNPRSKPFGWPTLLLASFLAWFVFVLSGCRDRAAAGPNAGDAADSLHDAVAAATPGAWHDELHLGLGTPGFIAARQGLRLARVDDRVRDALRAAREATVHIARRAGQKPARAGESAAVLEEATRRMRETGWERAVTVASDDSLVVVFAPAVWPEGPDIACSVLVQDPEQMVIVAAVVDRNRVGQLAEQLRLSGGNPALGH